MLAQHHHFRLTMFAGLPMRQLTTLQFPFHPQKKNTENYPPPIRLTISMTELVKHEQQEATTVAETQLQEEIEPLFMRQARPYTGILNVLSVALALVMFGSMLLMCLVVNIGEIIGWLTSFVNPRLGNKINTLFAGIGFFYFASLIEQFSGVSVEISGALLRFSCSLILCFQETIFPIMKMLFAFQITLQILTLSLWSTMHTGRGC